MKTTIKTIQQLKKHPLVSGVSREYNPDVFDNTDYTYWLSLKSGHIFKELGTGCLHEPSASRLIDAFNCEIIIEEK
jgi:hypothetical protein